MTAVISRKCQQINFVFSGRTYLFPNKFFFCILMFFQQIKVVLLGIVGLLRRALCCFSRKRKPSYSEPMTNVVVQPNFSQRAPNSVTTERDWNSWDDSPRTVEEHIEQYRQKIAKPPLPQAEEQEPDFFKELTPVIKPQPKYYLDDDTQIQTKFSRLQAKTDVPIALNAELEDWVDEHSGDWEEMDTEQAKQLIREKRRELRTMRQKVSTQSPHAVNHLQTSGIYETQVTS